MTEGKRVLIVSAIPTFPVNAGNRSRIWSLSKSLIDEGHEVHFAYAAWLSEEAADIGQLQSFYGAGRLHLLELDLPLSSLVAKTGRRLQRQLGFGGGRRFGLDEWYNHEATRLLRTLDARLAFDAVICEYVFMSGCLAAFPETTLKIIDTHDIFADRFERTGVGWYSISTADELRGLRRANVALAIQDEEAATLAARAGGSPQIVTVSHLIDMSRAVTPRHISPQAGFLSATNAANVAGLSYFLSEVMPLVSAAIPEFKLLLAGSIARAFPDHPGVVKLGVVPHPIDLYQQVRIALNPIQSGSGINIKLLDAIGCGVPCVTTATGARGLSRGLREVCFVVDDNQPLHFAEAVIAAIQLDQSAHAQKSRAAALAWNEDQANRLFDLIRSLD